MQAMSAIVLSYPKLQEMIVGDEVLINKSLKILQEIKASFSPRVTKYCIKFLDATLSKLYNNINYNGPDGQELIDLVDKHNVVFVPNHQSHADYLALNYIIYKKCHFPIYVAGGINLNIFLIGALFRKCGCFFIRRSFSNDPLYKLTLEAYLYYLLLKGRPIEFFFEGGRSRTGKLLPPKYGLYQMLLEAHQALPDRLRKKLLFVPVSIVHEYVPEQTALARELDGGKKKKESIGQLFKLFKLFARQFGSIHISLGDVVEPDWSEPIRKRAQNLAIDCFRRVGRNMVVTPSSLLALILLDGPSGAMEWREILAKAKKIVSYCQNFSVPFSLSLNNEQIEESMEGAITLLLANKKLNVIGGDHLGHIFYSIKMDCRLETLYFKNSILHHFLVPWAINQAWINVFNGSISTIQELENFFSLQRNQLIHEFYLPTVREFVDLGLEVISQAIGHTVKRYDEVINFSYRDLYSIVSYIGVFSTCCTFLQERYYISALSLQFLGRTDQQFKIEEFNKKVQEIFHFEMKSGRIIRYPESFSLQAIRGSIDYFTHQQIVLQENDLYQVINTEMLAILIEKYEKDLLDQLTFRIHPK